MRGESKQKKSRVLVLPSNPWNLSPYTKSMLTSLNENILVLLEFKLYQAPESRQAEK